MILSSSLGMSFTSDHHSLWVEAAETAFEVVEARSTSGQDLLNIYLVADLAEATAVVSHPVQEHHCS